MIDEILVQIPQIKASGLDFNLLPIDSFQIHCGKGEMTFKYLCSWPLSAMFAPKNNALNTWYSKYSFIALGPTIFPPVF